MFALVAHLDLVVGLSSPMTSKISKIHRVGANKELPQKLLEQTHYRCLCVD